MGLLLFSIFMHLLDFKSAFIKSTFAKPITIATPANNVTAELMKNRKTLL